MDRAYTTLQGRKFEIIPNGRCTTIDRNKVAIRTRPGDCRNPDDAYARGTIRRAGLDGWPQPTTADKGHDEFWFTPHANAMGQKAGDWLNFYERHGAGPMSNRAGPLILTNERSGDGKSYYRAWLTDMAGVRSLLGQILALADMRTRFTVDYRTGPQGWVSVSMGGETFATPKFTFGYGVPLYPCFRAYGNERPGPIDVDFEIGPSR
jgi:hypothetical protein